jgi:hypothetical protein
MTGSSNNNKDVVPVGSPVNLLRSSEKTASYSPYHALSLSPAETRCHTATISHFGSWECVVRYPDFEIYKLTTPRHATRTKHGLASTTHILLMSITPQDVPQQHANGRRTNMHVQPANMPARTCRPLRMLVSPVLQINQQPCGRAQRRAT